MDQLTPNDGQIPDKKPAIVVLSASGLELARKIARTVDADIHGHAIRCPEADVSFVRHAHILPNCLLLAVRS